MNRKEFMGVMLIAWHQQIPHRVKPKFLRWMTIYTWLIATHEYWYYWQKCWSEEKQIVSLHSFELTAQVKFYSECVPPGETLFEWSVNSSDVALNLKTQYTRSLYVPSNSLPGMAAPTEISWQRLPRKMPPTHSCVRGLSIFVAVVLVVTPCQVASRAP